MLWSGGANFHISCLNYCRLPSTRRKKLHDIADKLESNIFDQDLFRHMTLLCGASQGNEISADMRGLGLRLRGQFITRNLRYYEQPRFDLWAAEELPITEKQEAWAKFDQHRACDLEPWFERRLQRRRKAGEEIYTSQGWADLSRFVLCDGESVETIQNERQHTRFTQLLMGNSRYSAHPPPSPFRFPGPALKTCSKPRRLHLPPPHQPHSHFQSQGRQTGVIL